MKRKIAFILTLALSASLLAGCAGGKKSNTTTESSENTESSEKAESSEIVENSEAADSTESADTEEMAESDCFVTFEDGDSYDVPVSAYGEEFTLPEPEKGDDAGEFIGWIGMNGINQPGEKVVAEEFMSFTAIRADKDNGTVVMVDGVRGGYNLMYSPEEMELYSPYDDMDYDEHDDFFDYWTDDQGNTYEGRDMVKVNAGEVLILNAVYSTDTSAACKVDIYSLTGDEDTSEEYHRYVKKGESIPLWLMCEPAGLTFDGWYDAPEGGKLITDEMMAAYTPDSDISIYALWK